MSNEELFDRYEADRTLKNLQPLYSNGIYLVKIKDGTTERKTTLNTEGRNLIKAYDIINGVMTFTKIIVY